MSSLLPDLEGEDTCPSRALREASPQAVAGIPIGVEPCGCHPIANNQGHRFAGQLTGRDTPVSIDGPEDGTLLDLRGAEPVFERPDGAVNGSAERDADLALHA